jgi:hypothetical protein
LCLLDESQGCSGWRSIASLNLQWKADEADESSSNARKVQAADDPDVGLEQWTVCPMYTPTLG